MAIDIKIPVMLRKGNWQAIFGHHVLPALDPLANDRLV